MRCWRGSACRRARRLSDHAGQAQRRQKLDALQQGRAGAASAPDFFAIETLQPTWPSAVARCLRSAARNGDIFMPQSLRTRQRKTDRMPRLNWSVPKPTGATRPRGAERSWARWANKRAQGGSMVHNASKSLARWYDDALVRREALEPFTALGPLAESAACVADLCRAIIKP